MIISTCFRGFSNGAGAFIGGYDEADRKKNPARIKSIRSSAFRRLHTAAQNVSGYPHTSRVQGHVFRACVLSGHCSLLQNFGKIIIIIIDMFCKDCQIVQID